MRDIFYAGSFEVFWHWRGELGRCSQRTLDGATESGGRKVDELYQQRVAWGSCAIPRYRYWYRQAVRRRSRNLVEKCWCWSIGCLHSPPIVEPIKKPTMNIKKSEFSRPVADLRTAKWVYNSQLLVFFILTFFHIAWFQWQEHPEICTPGKCAL